MSELNIQRYLRWYKKAGDAAVGEECLKDINLNKLRNLFNVPCDDPMFDCWEVKEEHLENLQQYIKHFINLKKFDYFIEAEEMK